MRSTVTIWTTGISGGNAKRRHCGNITRCARVPSVGDPILFGLVGIALLAVYVVLAFGVILLGVRWLLRRAGR